MSLRLAAAVGGLVGAASLLAVAAPARAARPILLESHEEEPSPEVRSLLRVVHETVARFVDSGRTLAPRLSAFYGRAERALSDAEVSQIFAALRAASVASYRGEWSRAVAVLQRARALLRRDPQSVARRRPLFKALQQVRVLLARCYSRLGKTDPAWKMMEAALRAEPDLSLPGVFYGPLLQRLYYRVKTYLDLRRGTLQVTTYPSGALLFLSGRNVGVTPVRLSGLYQGAYELLVVYGPLVSRVRRVVVGSRPVSVRMDLAAQAPIRTTPFVGLLLPAGADRLAKETRLARDIGRRLGCGRVLLIGAQHVGGRLALVARRVTMSGRADGPVAYVYLDPLPPSRATLVRLARFLLHGGVPGGGVHVRPLEAVASGGAGRGPVGRRSAGRAAPRGGSRGLWAAGWALFGVGLAAAAGGGAAWVLDGRTSREATATSVRQVYHTRSLGIGLLAGGLGTAAVGAALLVVDAVRRPGPNRRGAAAGVSGRGGSSERLVGGARWTLVPWLGPGAAGLRATVPF